MSSRPFDRGSWSTAAPSWYSVDAPLTYEQYKEQVEAIAGNYHSLCQQGRENDAERAFARYYTLEAKYPEHAAQLAAELCTQESQEREWEY